MTYLRKPHILLGLVIVVAMGIVVMGTILANEFHTPKADGGPLNLQVIREAPVRPVLFYDCAGNLVTTTDSVDAAARYEYLDGLLMKESHDAGCLNEGVYEDYIEKYPDRALP